MENIFEPGTRFTITEWDGEDDEVESTYVIGGYVYYSHDLFYCCVNEATGEERDICYSEVDDACILR